MKIQFSENKIRIRFSEEEAHALHANGCISLPNEVLSSQLCLGNENQATLKLNVLNLTVIKNDFIDFLKEKREHYVFVKEKIEISIEKDLAHFKNGFAIQLCS